MRKRFSPATIIACVALFFSLGGASLAASHYLITSVNQIKPSVRHALRGHAGPAGPAGVQGVQGAAGVAGTAGTTGTFSSTSLVTVDSAVVDCAAGAASCSALALCPTGTHIVSGGITNASKPPENTSLIVDDPYNTLGWQLDLTNNAATPVSFRAVALCG